MKDSPPLCIVDANILIDLWHGGLLERFFDLSHSLVAPDLVITELKDPDIDHLLDLGLREVGLSGTEVLDVFMLRKHHQALSVPDLFAFVAARNRRAVLLTGDRRLRHLAKEEGLIVHGTLWVLDELVRENLIEATEGARALKKIMETGSRLPKDECQKRMHKWL